jgi:hypothetical protein
MSILDKAKAAGQGAAKSGAGKKSLYKGLAPRETRSDFFNDPGTHTVEIMITEKREPDAGNPWVKVEVKIVESPTLKAGETRTIKRDVHPKAAVVTRPELLSMTMALMGFASQEFEGFIKSLESDEAPGVSGEDLVEVLMMCVEGDAEAIAEVGANGTPLFGANPLAGMKAKVNVSPLPPLEGQTVSRLSNYSWYPLK